MTAAAVGMIANLAVFFAGRVLFPEGVSLSGLDLFALVAAAGSFAVLQRFRVPISTRWCLSAPCWALLARDPQTLAVGQQQRASVARALALEPEVLLMDEPTSALDGAARRTIEDLVLGLYAGLGLTMILVGHDLSQVGREADRVLLVSEGRSVGEWPRDEFFSFGGECALRPVSEGP